MKMPAGGNSLRHGCRRATSLGEGGTKEEIRGESNG